MSATAIRPKRGFREDDMYCPRCSVVWPSGYAIGGGKACPMPRPEPAPRTALIRVLHPEMAGRCCELLVLAEEAYAREQAPVRARRS